MKTSIYNKEEHLEGYVGNQDHPSDKSEVQKEYEAGNDTQEVTSFGKETIADINSNRAENLEKITTARDGLDNSGTQGADSLSDDSYHSKDKNPTVKSAESGTGSAGQDFDEKENKALNTGI